ncbi:hypothetical protein BVX98_00330 [bacterium F11]|nr:hypothetical protein BVX98_00330 [bacterium F11]
MKSHKAESSASWFYWTARFVCMVLFKVGWRLSVQGAENVPLSGSVIFSSNHRSYADPPLVSVSCPRPIHFLAKKELFRFRPFGWLITNLNSHPLNRKSGSGGVKEMQRLLAQRCGVLVFPEGKRHKSPGLGSAKPGVGLLAIKTKTPVVPIYIHNSDLMGYFKKLTVVYGSPISPEGFSSYQDFADRVLSEIQDLRKRFLKQ